MWDRSSQLRNHDVIFCWLPPDRIARANLARAFPEKTPAERNAIRRTMWDNLGRVVGEYPHLDKFTPKGEDGKRLRGTDKTHAKKRAMSARALTDLAVWSGGQTVVAA